MRRAPRIRLFLLAAAAALSLTAGVRGEEWTPIGPFGGTVEALVVSPGDPRILYAAARGGGVYRSDNGGRLWTRRNVGITDLAVLSLAVDPRDPETVYAGTETQGVFKSTDGGESWAAANQGLLCERTCTPVESLAHDPARSGTLYAVESGVVLKSVNGGATWKLSSAGLSGSVQTVEVDPRSSRILYVGTRQEGVYKSTDGGAHWIRLSAGLTTAAGLPVQNVVEVAVDPTNSSTVFASALQTGGRNVFKSTDGGRTWRVASRGLSPGQEQTVWALAVDPSSPRTVYAGTWSAGVFKSTDGGLSWRPAGNGLGPFRVNELVAHPTAPGVLWAATGRVREEGAGVYRTTNGAITWEPSRRGLSASNVTSLAIGPPVAPGEPRVLYAGTPSLGVLRSRDGGAQWALASQGLVIGGAVDALLVHPQDPAILYAATGAGVFQSTDGGARWTPKSQGLPGGEVSRVYSLAFHPTDPQTLYAGTQRGLFKSLDGGETWSYKGLDNGMRTISIAVSPDDPSVVYAGGDWAFGLTLPLLWRSDDAGETWRPAALYSRLTVAADPGDADTVLAGLYLGSLVRSPDGGASLETVDLNPAGREPRIYAVLFDPFSPGTAYVAAQDLAPPRRTFVARSVDGGLTWQRLEGEGLANVAVQTLAVDPEGVVYLGTLGSGILRLSGSGSVP